MAELLGQRSGTAWAGRTSKHKHRALPSRVQSMRAVTPTDPHAWGKRATSLAILTKFESRTVSLCKFRVTDYRAEYVFFYVKISRKLVTDQAVPIVSLNFLSGTILTLFSESIANKVCSQIGRKETRSFKAIMRPALTRPVSISNSRFLEHSANKYNH